MTWLRGGSTFYTANASDQQIMLVTAGEFWRIRHVRCINVNATTQGVSLVVGPFVASRYFRSSTQKLATGQVEDSYMAIWVASGQEVRAQTDVGSGMLLTIDYDVYV